MTSLGSLRALRWAPACCGLAAVYCVGSRDAFMHDCFADFICTCVDPLRLFTFLAAGVRGLVPRRDAPHSCQGLTCRPPRASEPYSDTPTPVHRTAEAAVGLWPVGHQCKSRADRGTR
eukprot:6203278-Pleurochrysis_carterae.AAC.2